MHPRYHSFYAWLLDEFWRRPRPRSRQAWIQFFRRREYIFSLACHLCDRAEHANTQTIVGSQKVAPMANQRRPHYSTDFDYIESDLGGYGLYYRSVIAELGLVYPGGQGLPYPIDVPTERGKQVADAFRRAVNDTAYFREYFEDDEAVVPIGVIESYARRACLCQLQVPSAPDRPLVLDTFLHAGSETGSKDRRDTLRLILDVAQQTAGLPVDQEAFRQLLYFGRSDSGAVYAPRSELAKTYSKWRLYQAREYYAFALNALWCYLCDWGIRKGGDVRPIMLSQLWEHLRVALDFDGLATCLGIPTPGLHPESDLIDLLSWLQGLVAGSDESFDDACGLGSPIHEHRLYHMAIERRADPAAMITGMLTMLALIFLRFGRPERALQGDWHISRMGEDGRLSLDGLLRRIRRRLQDEQGSIFDFAKLLYLDYVILQHQVVATSKLPDNTFRFQREGDRLRFYSLVNALGFNDSRFGALSTTVHELGLSGHLGTPQHALTPDGIRLLEDGDLA
jgi:hypothetical protein